MKSNIPELVNKLIRDTLPTLEGIVRSNPALLRNSSTGVTTWAVDVELAGMLAQQDITERTLKNVPISLPQTALYFAQLGMAVTLKRNRGSTTPFEIVGPAKSAPGPARKNVLVNVSTLTAATAVDWSITTHVLTLGEYSSLGTWGVTPIGATALYQGGAFITFV